MKLKQKETGRTGVMRACLDLLEAERIRHWRMNSGSFVATYKGRTRMIRGHAKGTPDLLALPQSTLDWNRAWGETPRAFLQTVVLWIECKAPGKHPTAEQLQFADDARNNGEQHIFVDDPKQLQDWLKENRAR